MALTKVAEHVSAVAEACIRAGLSPSEMEAAVKQAIKDAGYSAEELAAAHKSTGEWLSRH